MSDYNVVIACLPKGQIGTCSAATVATRMNLSFPSVHFGLMVGVGGGVPPKVRLGNVVVSVPADGFPGGIQWDMGKTEDGNTSRQAGLLDNPLDTLLTALVRLELKHEREGSSMDRYLEEMMVKYPRLALKYVRSNMEDICFQVCYNHATATSDLKPNSCRGCDWNRALRKPRGIAIHYGFVDSGYQDAEKSIGIIFQTYLSYDVFKASALPNYQLFEDRLRQHPLLDYAS